MEKEEIKTELKNKINKSINFLKSFTYTSCYKLFKPGAQCVVTHMWPLPDICVEKFYHSFYMALQSGVFVSSSIIAGIQALRDDER